MNRSGTLPGSARGASAPPRAEPPSYHVEHLASLAVGRQFGLQSAADGIRKLKHLEKKSALWPVPLILKLLPDRVSIEEESGDILEEFPLDLIIDPTAHQSSDPQDVHNNVLLFIVKEDVRSGPRGYVPPEIHIFQCVYVSAREVAEDLHYFTKGQYHRVRPGRHDSGFGAGPTVAASYGHGGPPAAAYPYPPASGRRSYRDDASAISSSTEFFETEVNTLNRCFDDIENFVARIQSAAIAQRELEMQSHRFRTQQRRNRAQDAAVAAQSGILHLRAQMPSYNEFYEIFQKFKLCFNLLAKLQNHIHEPDAPQLLHFLFTPLSVILDACHWGLGRNVAEQVLSPLLSFPAIELLKNSLTSKEYDIWMMLGKAWHTPPEEWPGQLPPPYRPVFVDGFAPYGYPQNAPAQSGIVPPTSARFAGPPSAMHRGVSAPPVHYSQAPPPRSTSYRERSVDNLELERVNLEKERLEFERMKVLEKERRLLDEEKRLRQEQARIEAERRLLHKEAEKQSIAGSDRPDFYRRDEGSAQASPQIDRRTGSVQVLSNGHVAPSNAVHRSNGAPASAVTPPIAVPDQSPRQKAFLDELIQRRSKVVQVTYDRVAQNPKELTVARGEYLEVCGVCSLPQIAFPFQVLSDSRNWWECRNVHNRNGYVPHTILSVVTFENASPSSDPHAQGPQRNPPSLQPAPSLSPRPDAPPGNVYAEQERVQQRPYNGWDSISDGIQSVKLRHVNVRSRLPDLPEEEAAKEVSKMIIERREEQRYVPEMVDTLKRRRQVIGMRRIDSIRGESITKDSTPDKIQQWLRDKGFSTYVQGVLRECTGEDLFRLTKDDLRKVCGDEGSRIYSLVLVHKKRSHYDTGKEQQLRALLDMRKEHVDTHNDGAIEPDLPAPADPVPKEPPPPSPPAVSSIVKSNTPNIASIARSVRSYR
ncbi:CRE-EPS-8 protein [Aphelenchoides avenae]|nr:CRE-EPS-8 protein [Aphelenchus avenae]